MVKNGAKDLRRSLESLAKHVDEIIVVDTGSTDDTIAVAEEFGAKIFHEPWQNDFATPRNVAIRAAKGDWIVFLDADEYFLDDTAKNLRGVIDIARRHGMTMIYVKFFNVDADNNNRVIVTDYLPRIFENAPSVHYAGKIHEEVERDDKPLERVMAPADKLTIYHTGYSASIVLSKLKRNLKLLLEELETSDDPARTYGYLVDCYHGLEDWANAEKYARLEVEAQRNLSMRPLTILLDILKKDAARADEYFKFTKLAVERYPHMPECSARLAACFAEQGKYREAVAEMERALDKFENFGEHFEMTTFTAETAEKMRQLIDEWRRLIDYTPDEKRREIAKLMDELIQAVEVTHDREKVLKTSEKIFALHPDEPAPVERVASIYIDYKIENIAEAVVAYLEENFPPSPYRLLLSARFQFLKKNCRNAIKIAEQALELEGGDLITNMLLRNLLGQAYRLIGNVRKAIEHYKLNAERDLPASVQSGQAEMIRHDEYSNYLFNLHNLNISREELFAATRGFNDLLANIPRHVHNRKKHARHKKIRIGYISPDVRFHVVAFFSAHFFTDYDKTRFEVFVYANNAADHITEQIAAAVDGFRNISDTLAKDVAAQIVQDEVDILIDLAGHSANNLLEVLAYKPAPIQLSGVGYFDSTGLDTMDYFIADKFTDPEGLNERFFTEKLLRLQHSHFCYVWHDLSYPVSPAPCTQAGYVTFASFNNFAKVTDDMLALWSRILRGVPHSRLYLKAAAFKANCGLEPAKERMTAAGIDLERVDFEDIENDYVRRYERVDIALDTFPYPGGGTTCDALYMGVPVITLVGERHNSRFGYSLLVNMGLEELCAFNADDYVQKAVELANDTERLREYHLTLRRRMELSPVMNDTIYMGEVERAYEKIFTAWLDGKALPDFPQEPAQITPELAEEYYRRAESYVPLELANGESKFNRVDFKRTLYYAELAAQCPTRRDARLYLMIADRRHMTDDNVGAYEAMRKAIELIGDGRYSNFFIAECYSKLGKFALDNRRVVEAVESYSRAFELAEDVSKQLEYYDSILLSLYFTDIPSAEMAAAHFDYQNLLDAVAPFTTYHSRNERIKVGYISGDFRRHAAFAVMFGFMSCHDRSKFEVTCYSNSNVSDEFTELYKRGVEHFVDVSDLTAAQLAQRIHDDAIDIAVDLAGHTSYNGLHALAYRPAPVQVSGLGYMSTTGLKAIDYFITDAVLDPPEEGREQFFSEKFLYMPAQFSYAQRLDLPASNGAPCLKTGHVTFGTICRYSKITDEMLAVWTEILNRVPTAKLLMRAQEFISNKTVDELYNALKSLGCDMERVTIRPAVHDYFGAISQLDICLDAYPYVGGATTLDALYMGVPVVNLYGERHSSRFGKSILHSVGLEELAVDNVAAYIETAVALANDVETLDALHKGLRQMFLTSEALDPVKYCRTLEAKFEELLS